MSKKAFTFSGWLYHNNKSFNGLNDPKLKEYYEEYKEYQKSTFLNKRASQQKGEYVK